MAKVKVGRFKWLYLCYLAADFVCMGSILIKERWVINFTLLKYVLVSNKYVFQSRFQGSC